MKSDPYLRRTYRELNRRYFNNRCPNKNVTVRFVRDSTIQALADVWIGTSKIDIRINRKLKFSPRLCVRELIHEMAHVLHPGSYTHGRVFSRTLRKTIHKAIYWY